MCPPGLFGEPVEGDEPCAASALASLSRFRVSGGGVGQPDDASLIVDAVPEAPSAGDLVLPLLQLLAVDQAVAKGAFQGVLALTPLPGIDDDPLPGHAGAAGSGSAHLLPARDGVAGGVPEVQSA